MKSYVFIFLPVDQISRNICSTYAAWNFYYFYQKVSLNIFKPDFSQYAFKVFEQTFLYGSIKIYSNTSFLIVIKIYNLIFFKSYRVSIH